MFNNFFPYLVLLGVVFIGLLIFWWCQSRRTFFRDKNLDYQTLLVQLPQTKQTDNRDNFLAEINQTEQLFLALATIGRPVVYEIAVNNYSEEIMFYLAVPRQAIEFTERQIQGLFPEAKVSVVNDYTVFVEAGASIGAWLGLATDYLLPLRSYRESETDTLSPIISTLSKLQKNGEGAGLQFVVRPAGENIKKLLLKKLELVKTGRKLSDLQAMDSWSWRGLAKVFFANNSETSPVSSPALMDENLLKAIQMKIAKPLWLVNLRVVASADDRQRAEDLFLSMANAFSHFSAPLRNSFKIVRPRRPRGLFFKYIFREFVASSAMVLSSEELASLYHLPTSDSKVPRIARLNSREVAPPSNLPNDGLILGENVFREEKRQIGLSVEDRRRHLYLIGQTGTGKSWLMKNLFLADLQAGHGACLIDPHGDLTDDLLGLVPATRLDDVIVFNPGDVARPLGLNMLTYDLNRPEEKTFIVNELQSIFNQLFLKETMGPMFEKYMRNTLLLLMEDFATEATTLLEVPRVLTDNEYRERKLKRINNPAVVDFWTKEAPRTSGEQGLANMAPYISSKLDGFILNDYLRPILGQAQSAFNFRQLMDERKILMVNLAKGKIGDISSRLIGMIVVGRLLMAALSRQELTESSRQDFYLYIDEFQNYTTESIAVILAEARKYRLNLTIAHQFIKQLTDDIRESVFGNIGNLLAFRVGVPDAEFLVKYFGPEFTVNDLSSLENQKMHARILVNGEPSRPFNLQTLPGIRGSAELAEKIKELSRLRFGRDLPEIDREILARARQ